MRALMGADGVRGGKTLLEGEAVTHRSPVEAWHNGLAFVPEERRSQGLILSRSVSNNITLPHLGKLSRGGLFLDGRREGQLSEKVGGSGRLRARNPRRTVRGLSGGNQQKLICD